MCASTSLTRPTLFQVSGDSDAKVHFRIRDPAPGFFAATSESFVVDRASICMECGHMILGFSEGRLAELREKMATLEPTT